MTKEMEKTVEELRKLMEKEKIAAEQERLRKMQVPTTAAAAAIVPFIAYLFRNVAARYAVFTFIHFVTMQEEIENEKKKKLEEERQRQQEEAQRKLYAEIFYRCIHLRLYKC
jgi:hypothetical protein